MGVTTATVMVAAKTGAAGTQDITTAKLGGLTPKAAFITISRGSVAGTGVVHEVLSKSIVAGTDMYALCGAAEENSINSDTYCYWSATKALVLLDPSGVAATDGYANLTGGGFITDGIRLNWPETPASGYLIEILFIAGTDAVAAVGSSTSITTVAETQTHGLGEVPALIMLLGCNNEAADTLGNEADWTIGVSDGTVHRAFARIHRDGQGSTTRIAARTSTAKDAIHISNTGTITDALTIGNLTTTGFDLTPDVTWAGRNIGWLALGFGGVAAAKILSWVTPTAIGNAAVTGVGFQPEAGFGILTHMPGGDVTSATDDAGVAGIYMFDDTDAHCVGIQSDDARGGSGTETVSQSLADSKIVNLPDATTAAAYVATLASIDADGWTHNFSAVDGVAHTWFLVAFEGVAGSGPSGTAQSVQSATEVQQATPAGVFTRTAQALESASEIQNASADRIKSAVADAPQSASEVQRAQAVAIRPATPRALESSAEVQLAASSIIRLVNANAPQSATEIQSASAATLRLIAAQALVSTSEIGIPATTTTRPVAAQAVQSASEIESGSGVIKGTAQPLAPASDTQIESAASVTVRISVAMVPESASEIEAAAKTVRFVVTAQAVESAGGVETAASAVKFIVTAQAVQSAGEIEQVGATMVVLGDGELLRIIEIEGILGGKPAQNFQMLSGDDVRVRCTVTKLDGSPQSLVNVTVEVEFRGAGAQIKKTTADGSAVLENVPDNNVFYFDLDAADTDNIFGRISYEAQGTDVNNKKATLVYRSYAAVEEDMIQ